MKNILCIYFTGTYHTEHLVNRIKEEKEKDGNSVSLLSVSSSADIKDISSFDEVIFSYPIYAFRAPKPYIDYLKKLRFRKETEYYVYKQSGEPFSYNNSSSCQIEKLLKKQGCHLSGEFHFLYPYNILFAYDEEWKKKLKEYNEYEMMIASYYTENHIQHLTNCSFLKKKITGMISHLQHFGAKINGPLYHVKKKDCSKCHLCLKSCPYQNISLDKKGYPVFHSHCAMCMRCSYCCPKDCIKIGILNSLRINQFTKANDKHKRIKKKFFSAYQKYIDKEKELYSAISERN